MGQAVFKGIQFLFQVKLAASRAGMQPAAPSTGLDYLRSELLQ